MAMIQIIIATLPTFLLILFGVALKAKNCITEPFCREAEKLTYYVLFPALLISHLSHADFSEPDITRAITATLLGTTMISLLVFISRLIIPYQNTTFTSVFQGCVRYNSYIFLAISEVLLGQQGVIFAAVIIAYMIIFTNLTSVFTLSMYGAGGKSSKDVLLSIAKNPVIISAAIGIIFALERINLGLVFSTFLDYLGRAALPLSLLCVGAGLRLRVNRDSWAAIISSSLVKLLGVPIATALFLGWLNVTEPIRSICVLYAAVPCPGNAYILARQMGGDAEAMASIIMVTTLLSLITMAPVLGFL